MQSFRMRGAAAWLLTATTASVLPAMPASAFEAAATAPIDRATAQSSRQFDFTSKINGSRYRVRVAVPQVPAPAGGFAVLYVLDGDGYFGLFADELLIRAVVVPELQPTIVVGIGYPTDDVLETLHRRWVDLTPSADANLAKWVKPYKGDPVQFGGADRFRQVILQEIAPRIGAIAPADLHRTVIWGHSLGGLFVLDTLFKHPEAFGTYLAMSPSFPYNNNSVLKNEEAFRQQLAAGKVAPRVMIAAGSRELGLPFDSVKPVHGISYRMDGADPISQLATRLASYAGPPGYAATFRLMEGETHVSVPFASANTALEFALPGPPPPQPPARK